MSKLINKVYGQGLNILNSLFDGETVNGFKAYLSESYDGDREMAAREIYEWVERAQTMDEAIAIKSYLAAFSNWYFEIDDEPMTIGDSGEWTEDELDQQELINENNAKASYLAYMGMRVLGGKQFATWFDTQLAQEIHDVEQRIVCLWSDAYIAEATLDNSGFQAKTVEAEDLSKSIQLGNSRAQHLCDVGCEMGERLIQAEEERQERVADLVHRAEMQIMDAHDANDWGSYDACDAVFDRICRQLGIAGAGDEVADLCERWDTMETKRTNGIDGANYQSIATMILGKLILPCGDGRYCATLPETHRIELLGTIKGRQVTQIFKTIVPTVWVHDWQARIVVVAA